MYKVRDFVLSCLISTSSKMICVRMRFYFLTSINSFFLNFYDQMFLFDQDKSQTRAW